jgi:hypothetical protein
VNGTFRPEKQKKGQVVFFFLFLPEITTCIVQFIYH